MIIAMNAVLQQYAPAGQGDSFITCATIVQSFMLIITIPLGGISGGTTVNPRIQLWSWKFQAYS